MAIELEGRLEEILSPLLRERDLDLVDLEIKRAGSRRIVRIFVSRTEGYVLLDECADLSKELSVQMDARDLISGSFVLEVSSPGLERLLRKERELDWARGKRVRLFTRDGEFRGTLAGHSSDEIRIELDGVEKAFDRKAVSKLKLDEVRP
jgi:ribosome maturation factor RimP